MNSNESENQKRTIKVSEETYQAMDDIAELRFGNRNAVTWSGLILDLCREHLSKHEEQFKLTDEGK